MRDLLAALTELRERLPEIPQADERRLPELKTEILGRKAGALTKILAALPRLEPAARKRIGAAANALKHDFEAAFASRERDLKRAAGAAAGVDLTMPGRARWPGGLHLVTQVVDEICEIFHELGFTRAVGPLIETERYNFYALNFPKDHPALDSQDSFYLGGDLLLRTHTSPVQIRTLERYPPPIRVVIPGQVYRRDPFDASHSPVFEQIEGLAVDAGITFIDFKATLATFARKFFSADTRVRFRPSFFPFTEPSAGGAARPDAGRTRDGRAADDARRGGRRRPAVAPGPGGHRDRARAGGEAPPQRRPPHALPRGRWGRRGNRRPGGGRVRRAQRAGRQAVPLRPGGRGAAGRREARAQDHPRRRVERHALLGERARAGPGSRGDPRARHRRRPGHALRRRRSRGRSPDRHRRSREPARPAVPQGCGPGAGSGAGRRREIAGDPGRTVGPSDRRTESPCDRATARPQCGGRRGGSPRGSRGVPPLYGGGDPRGPGGGEPPLARWPAERGRPAADQ